MFILFLYSKKKKKNYKLFIKNPLCKLLFLYIFVYVPHDYNTIIWFSACVCVCIPQLFFPRISKTHKNLVYLIVSMCFWCVVCVYMVENKLYYFIIQPTFPLFSACTCDSYIHTNNTHDKHRVGGTPWKEKCIYCSHVKPSIYPPTITSLTFSSQPNHLKNLLTTEHTRSSLKFIHCVVLFFTYYFYGARFCVNT